METGAVKFQYECSGKELIPFLGFEELNAARQELRRLNLIGVDENGLGFGNVSLREETSGSFYITGSGTGALPVLTLRDFAKVVAWDFERNWLRCEGCTVASAESRVAWVAVSFGDECCDVGFGPSNVAGTPDAGRSDIKRQLTITTAKVIRFTLSAVPYSIEPA